MRRRRHCQRCAEFHDPEADTCDSCGRDISDDPVVRLP